MKESMIWLRYDAEKKEFIKKYPLKTTSAEDGILEYEEEKNRQRVTYTAFETVTDCSIGLEYRIEDWDRKDYILVPAAVYDANRFRVLKVPYAPMFRQEQYQKDPEITITDIPHLSKEGEGWISLRAGDSSVPSLFIYRRRAKKLLGFLYPCQLKEDLESGIQIHETEENTLEIRITAPIVRSHGMYRFGNIRSDAPCEDAAATVEAGTSLSIWIDRYEEDCEDLTAFYRRVMEISRLQERIAGGYSHPHQVPLSKAFQLVEEKYNKYSWNSDPEFYCVGEGQNRYAYWQTGWVGGINAAYPLYCDGDSETQKRAIKTMDFMFRQMQAPCGLFYGGYYEGKLYGDDFAEVEKQGFSLVRKSADALYFAVCILLEMGVRKEQADPVWIRGLQRCAEGFCQLFEREGQIGQFLDVDSGKILVGGSASGGLAAGGLALCALYFKEPRYLKTACDIGRYYYENYTKYGMANGGPGEILSAPDSESAYALTESYTVLYEQTQDPIYLKWAEDAAAVYATWCMPYDYPFSKRSEFGKKDMRTTGAVWANVQNKHGAPGPCTHSGSAMFRLARYTGKSLFMEICRDTSHNITQYLSRDDRPLWNYSHTVTSPSGFMCERVSTSDWEGYDAIGGVYETGCWCEATTMCIYTDIPGIWVDTVRKKLWVSDHLVVSWEKEELVISNPTQYTAEVKILIDRGEWQKGDFDYRRHMRKVRISAQETIRIGI